MSNNRKEIGILAVIIAIVAVIVFSGVYLTRNIGKTDTQISEETAMEKLAKYVKNIGAETGTPTKGTVEYDDDADAADELPDIDTCDVTVSETTDVYAEIWSSPEKAGTGTDGWLTEMAESFNAEGYELDGEKVSIRLRKVNSGQAVDYITTGAARPDGFSPSAMFWADMAEADGVDMDVIAESLVGNVAGIVIANEKYDEFTEAYGSVDVMSVTEAAADGFAFGYTNPFSSTTGLNFLMCTLLRYDADSPLSDTAAAGFSSFQADVPLVSLTTLQMRSAADNGTLDGFVMEYQSYANDASMKGNYTFTPFGFRHDNPLVAVEGASDTAKEILELFANYCLTDSAQELADSYGFNDYSDYSCEYGEPDGATFTAAQSLYKENKDSGKTVVAVFVADVSGSMAGDPILALQESLINSMQYIDSDNYIGLVSYNGKVTIELPLAQFDLTQQAYFKGTVEALQTGGNTATYSAILVALNMIETQLEETPDAIPMIFVLSDGETNAGYSYSDIKSTVEGLNVPVYTIAYGSSADSDALQKIADINEAAFIETSTDDIVYQLKQLFNASM